MPTDPSDPNRELEPGAFRRVVRLARIELSEEEERELSPQLAEIVEWIEDLRQWKGDGEDGEEERETASDSPGTPRPAPAGLDQREALERAPEGRDGFFVVPGPRPQRDPAGDEDE